MNDIKLKPCPFCGGEAKLWIQCEDDENKGEELGVVECPHCGITQCVADPVADAVARWNTRAAVTETDFSRAVHDGELWEKRRTCRLAKDDCYWRCTECRSMFLTTLDKKPKYRYCPNCGAKVVEE